MTQIQQQQQKMLQVHVQQKQTNITSNSRMCADWHFFSSIGGILFDLLRVELVKCVCIAYTKRKLLLPSRLQVMKTRNMLFVTGFLFLSLLLLSWFGVR